MTSPLETLKVAARRAAARAPDRFESQDLAFFEAVRSGYAQRFAADPGRVLRLDAAATPDEVALMREGGLLIGGSPGLGTDEGDVEFGDRNHYLAEIGGTRKAWV